MVKRQLVLNTHGIILALNFSIFGHRKDTFHIFYNFTVGFFFLVNDAFSVHKSSSHSIFKHNYNNLYFSSHCRSLLHILPEVMVGCNRDTRLYLCRAMLSTSLMLSSRLYCGTDCNQGGCERILLDWRIKSREFNYENASVKKQVKKISLSSDMSW